ncbi:MAG TPA: DUF1707 domain-containing protein [Streptosporangiaceae bacterium]|nr:DUF1707 domain-containing protein [Streptosporangiaceae bacterium]
MASQPSLRVGDSEREAVAAELREHFARGRLTLAEFQQRLDAVFASKTQRDLSRITSDLPHVRPDDVPLPSSGVGRARRVTDRPPTDGRPRYRQGGDRQHGDHHHGGGFLATLLAAVAAWLLVYDVILVGLSVPLIGRLGLLAAIFTVIRGLLRRIFRGRRGTVRRRW